MSNLRAFRETYFPQLSCQNTPHSIIAKITFIEGLHEKVWVHHEAQQGKRQGITDFDRFIEYLEQTWRKACDAAFKSPEVAAVLKGKSSNPIDQDFKEWLMRQTGVWVKQMARVAYEPYPSTVHLFHMLTTLWFFWFDWPRSREWVEADHSQESLSAVSVGVPPSFGELETTLDLSLAKLSFLTGIVTTAIRHKGKKKEVTARINVKKKIDAGVKKAQIIQIYHRSSKIKVGMKLNAVSKAIEDVFKGRQERGEIQKSIDSPSHYQIKRYLEKDGIVDRDFKLVGRFKIKQT